MNRQNELLLILSEECAEVQQAAIKCIRFGMDSMYCGETNRVQLEAELGDFMAMFRLILEESDLCEENIMAAAERKLIKVEHFMKNGNPKPQTKSSDHGNQGQGGKNAPPGKLKELNVSLAKPKTHR